MKCNDIAIQRSVGQVLGANQYVLTIEDKALVIDACTPPEDALPVGTILDAILLTHEHYDHICFANEWASYYGAPIWCGRSAAAGIANPRMNMSHYGAALFEAIAHGDRVETEIKDYVCVPDRTFVDGEKLTWQGTEIRVLETPGHSPGSICLLVADTMLFCGDTLLAEEATGTRFRGADKCLLKEVSFPALRTLNGNITVFPGHGPTFQLKDYCFWEETT